MGGRLQVSEVGCGGNWCVPYVKPRQQLQVISSIFWEGSSACLQLWGSYVAWTSVVLSHWERSLGLVWSCVGISLIPQGACRGLFGTELMLLQRGKEP